MTETDTPPDAPTIDPAVEVSTRGAGELAITITRRREASVQ